MSETTPAVPGNGAAPTTTAVTKAEATKAPVAFGDNGVMLRSLDDAYRFSTAVAKSGLAPKGLDTPEKILVAIQYGAEAGLGPMASLRAVVVINGRPGWTGDAALALVRASGKMIRDDYGYEGEGDKLTAWFLVHRKGDPAPTTERFSVADAKLAGLWGKPGPWSQYPKRMLRYRAMGFLLRDKFTDVLNGFPIAEELQDYPSDRPAGERPAPELVAPAALPAPTALDPLMAEVLGAETRPAAEPEPEPAEVPAPSPFPSHAEADRALAEADIDEVFAPREVPAGPRRPGRRS